MLFKYIKFTLLISNIYNLLHVDSFIKPYYTYNKIYLSKLKILKRPNVYNNSMHHFANYLNNDISSKKNFSNISQNYLEELNNKYKLKIDNLILSEKNIIKKITFDELIMFNNYIDVIYYNNNINSDKIIIEFKNNTRKVYYYDNNFDKIKEILITDYIKIINMDYYPYYILNSPLGFLLCEEK